MFLKRGYAKEGTIRTLTQQEAETELASPEIANRLEKHARRVQALAPKSDDFLYFTIIFLKAAESALIDMSGNQKKVGSEKAWGYFDENYTWHGNVKPHKNNNGDIFPESELKIAARKWIGMPLCVDHKSDSVDGIRGIILDTYYDEKLKQVVGLCALDKINYPDLARKVSTGVVRYGSMGTAVEISVCTECPNRATTPSEYCDHVLKRTAWGEINVGLRPIEYSLVVQPAEPGAKLLRCIASIKNHESELKNYGVEDVDELTNNLTIKQAEELNRVLNAVCGEEGCSIKTRKGVVTSYLEHNGFIKAAALNEEQEVQVQFAEALAEIKKATGKSPEDPDAYELYAPIFDAFGRSMPTPTGEAITSGQTVGTEPVKTIMSPKDDHGTPDYTGTGGDTGMLAGVTEPSESFGETGGVGPESYAFASDEFNFDSIIGEIMKESRLRKRAEMRRRLAYHQGGADGVEPSGTYKDEGAKNNQIRETQDKQMLTNPANLGGTDGMVPGDKEVKEKLSRAELEEQGQKRVAYHQGGAAPAVEPNTYKSEDYYKYWQEGGKDADKQMHPNPKNLGGTDGMVPGDAEVKEKLQRMAAYEGPPLSTRFTQLRNLDGTINKAASKFEVFAGEKLVIATTAKDIWGPELEKEWTYMTSKDYGKNVVAGIRAEGLDKIATLLTKQAQEALPPMEEPAAEAPLGEEPLPSMEEPAMPEEDMAEEDPKAIIDEAFMAMEEAMDEIKEAMDRLGGGDVDINVNVGEEGVEAPEKLALSQTILKSLKNVLAEANESADELALLSQTYDNMAKLSSKQKVDLKKLSREAVRDSAELVGESSALLSMAKTMANAMVKTSTYSEEEEILPVASEKPAETEASEPEKLNSLAAETMQFRKQRREEILRKAAEKLAAQKKVAEMKDCAHDADDDCEECADDNESKASDMESAALDPVGSHYEEAVNMAVDADEAHEIAEDEAEEEVEKHEDEHHAEDGAVNAAEDTAVNAAEDVAANEAEDAVANAAEDTAANAAEDASIVQAKIQESFIQKKSEEERGNYRLKVRRAYDIAKTMQEKGLIPASRAALERQVDDIMLFDDNAFESFKRTVASARAVSNVKVASDLGEINVGVSSDESVEVQQNAVDALASMWD